jgi:hypothetical protein
MSLTKVKGVVLPLKDELQNPTGSEKIGYNSSTVGLELNKFNNNISNFVSRITDFGVGFANWPQGKGTFNFCQ